MRGGKTMIALFTAVLCLLLWYIFRLEGGFDTAAGLTFRIQSEGTKETIRYWENDGKFYVFLPTYSDVSDVEIQLSGSAELQIGDVVLEQEMRCDSFLADVEYVFSGNLGKRAINSTITFVHLGTVPTMHLDTRSGKMEYIHKVKGNEEAGTMRLYTETGLLDYSGDFISLKGRGNATWTSSKKPYNLTLRSEADLLGMGFAQKWVLLANAFDASNLNNKMAFDLAKKAGMQYTPDCEWVDLYLNGEYAGLYLLSEKVEIAPERVNISAEEGFLVSGELLNRLVEQGYPHTVTEKGMALRIHFSALTDADLNRIWQSVENAILSETGTDPVSGQTWQDLIDMDSWVMRLLMDECFANYDGGNLSQYFYYDPNSTDGKVAAGPVWDMDTCLTRKGSHAGHPNSIVTHRKHHMIIDDAPLYYALYQKPEFYQRIVELYENAFAPALTELAEEGFSEYQKIIYRSARANQLRWNSADWQETCNAMKDFLTERLAFLNDYWLRDAPYVYVHLAVGETNWWGWGCIALHPGETAPVVYDLYQDDWYNMDTNEPFCFDQPVTEDITIYHGDDYWDNCAKLRQLYEIYRSGNGYILQYLTAQPSRVSRFQLLPIAVLCLLFLSVYIVDRIRKGNGVRNDRKSTRNAP